MDTNTPITATKAVTPKKSNPIFVIAAIAVTLFSAIGIGALTGLIPSSHSNADANKSVAAPVAPVAPKMEVKTAAAPEASVVAPVTTAKLGADTSTDATISKAQDKVLQPEAPVAKTAPAPKVVHKPAPHKTVVANNTHTTAPAAPVVSAPVSQPQYVPAPEQPVQVAAAPTTTRAICGNCGVVESINAIAQKGEATGLGGVLGGAAGAVIGHQVGGGRGKDVATVLGAVGGAVAGNEVEKNRKSTTAYDVVVRLEDNTTRTVRATAAPAYGVGSKVKVVDGQVVAN